MLSSKPTPGIYVSAFLTDRTIPHEPDEAVTTFTLHGAGYGTWTTEGDSVIVAEGSVFIVVTWNRGRRGTAIMSGHVTDQGGVERFSRPLFEQPIEAASDQNFFQCHYNLQGLELPIGLNFPWIALDGTPVTPVLLRVFGPE